MTYRFGPFEADRTTYRVCEGPRALDLTPKLLDLLFYLLDHPAALVTKEELLDGVWPDANVTDNALAQAVSELREALGDSASAPTYIRTVARRGYRFIAPVETIQPAAAPPSPAPPGTTSATAVRSIAVLDFANMTGDTEVAWLAAGIPETVTSDLAGLGAFRVIDRWRVLQASHQSDGSVEEISEVLGVDLVVTGGFQRLGTELRITARVVDRGSGETVADAKVDGLLRDVFALQDAVVSAFAQELGVPPGQRSGRRHGGRETSSLEAYRSYTEGWLKIESLDTGLVAASIRDFEHAVRLDPAYALAHTGLANASFVAFEMTRSMLDPDQEALDAGIEHARRAIRLDDRLAEAHATLSFLLVSRARFDEAREAGQQAVSLEPDNWRHLYRLGHATWGAQRLKAMERATALYPQFAYALFESTMVHVARGDLALAEELARQGVADQDRRRADGNRFPAIGFHWLLGTLAAAGGRHDEAIDQFERELRVVDPRRLYGPEYGALAHIGMGHARLSLGQPDAALASFRTARDHVAGHARAWLGEALALGALDDEAGAGTARQAAARSIARVEATGRPWEALYGSACHAAVAGDLTGVLARLDRLLESEPPSFHGWTIPIEPSFRPLTADPGFAALRQRLADLAK